MLWIDLLYGMLFDVDSFTICGGSICYVGWIALLCVMDRFAMVGVDCFNMHGGRSHYVWWISLL